MTRAVFLDRDGVINDVTVKNGIAYGPRLFSDFNVRHGVAEEVARLKQAGFLVIVVTNQPDIARAKMTQDELDRMTNVILTALGADDVMVCPHDDADACPCRKPKPGLLIQAAERYGIDCSSSFLIGDTWKDIAAGKAAGCARTFLIDTCYNQAVKDATRVAGLREAVDFILNDRQETSWQSS